MTSKQIKDLLNLPKGKEKIYKLAERHFALVDKWEERLISGDLLNEYELSEIIDRLTGCLMKLGTIAGSLESYKEFVDHDTYVKLISEIKKEKGKVTGAEEDEVKVRARLKADEIADIASDFRSYFYAASSAVTSAQSRIKRLSIEKGAKGVDYTGETPVN